MIRRCIPTEVRAKIKGKTAEYKEFCNACGVPAATSRLRYECGTSDIKKQSATMNIAEDKRNIEVHTVGKIDKEIFKYSGSVT